MSKPEDQLALIMTCLKHSSEKHKPNFDEVERELGIPAKTLYHRHWKLLKDWGVSNSRAAGAGSAALSAALNGGGGGMPPPTPSATKGGNNKRGRAGKSQAGGGGKGGNDKGEVKKVGGDANVKNEAEERPAKKVAVRGRRAEMRLKMEGDGDVKMGDGDGDGGGDVERAEDAGAAADGDNEVEAWGQAMLVIL